MARSPYSMPQPMLMEMAYLEVGTVAERYINIINELFVSDDDV